MFQERSPARGDGSLPAGLPRSWAQDARAALEGYERSVQAMLEGREGRHAVQCRFAQLRACCMPVTALRLRWAGFTISHCRLMHLAERGRAGDAQGEHRAWLEVLRRGCATWPEFSPPA